MCIKYIHGRVSINTLNRLLINTWSISYQHLITISINTWSTLDQHLDWHLINSQSTVGWYRYMYAANVNQLIFISQNAMALIECWPTCRMSIDQVSIQQDQWRTINQHSTVDVYMIQLIIIIIISNSNWTEWSTIQGVIAQVISKSDERESRVRFEITNTITPWIVLHSVQLLINRIYNKFRN